MTRNAEYTALLAALEATPEALQYTVQRATARARTARKRRRIVGIPVGSLLAFALCFVLLVNLFPVVAYACGRVPLLRDLAKAVAWSPSLSAAVDNAYVQPISQSQTKNGVTATVEYVIVDQKQLNIFFTLQSDEYETLSTTTPGVSLDQDCNIIGAGLEQPVGQLQHYTLDYGEQAVPDHLTVTLRVTAPAVQSAEPPAEDPDWDFAAEMLAPLELEQPEVLAEFSFTLEFDPEYTAPGEIIPVNQSFVLDGQTLTLAEVAVYPTHVRVNFAEDDANTAWLYALSFYLEDETGRQFQPVSGSILATGLNGSSANTSFRLESPYFADCRSLTLHITEATWLDKELERVRIDLVHQAADTLPEGVTLLGAEKREDGWVLQFQARWEQMLFGNPVWSMVYYDAAGTAYEMPRIATSTSLEANTYVDILPLQGYTEDVVWLSPLQFRVATPPTPIVIAIQ